ncbi:cytochrome c/c1 heme-lyase [Globomyces pollinis-pini]|nr:cytochrome c/c1 heme-lyase [Globomyces pollinis-pini]KAJ2991358.1 hypothetical protein HDV02_003836 [Globomyces sp. JEL0801]
MSCNSDSLQDECPMRNNNTNISQCPVDHNDQHPLLNPTNHMDLHPNQTPAQDQRIPLDIHREESSIPMGGKNDGKNWVYPSEQMFFNAMKRKNWNPNEKDMKSIIPIHNAVNEQCWHWILKWEALHTNTCKTPKLLKFEGRAKDYTPKARFKQLLGYKLPFDRHDWTIDRCGETVTYVIDFYSGTPVDGKPASFYLDVRPAMTFSGLRDRFMFWWKNL